MINWWINVAVVLELLQLCQETLCSQMLLRRQGPVFIYEPPRKVEFLNTKGVRIDCSAHGNPDPEVRWSTEDGRRPLLNNTNSRRVFGNGSLIFPPFPSDVYEQKIHATVYRCIAENRNGLIISRPVYLTAVVDQPYQPRVYDEYVIKGNTAVMACHIPSFVSNYVSVTAWIRDDHYVIRPTENLGGRYSIFQDGYLHIRNAMPSDAMKSFWCQTRHKLTQQTIMSVTSGKLLVTEPHSSIAPRVTHRVTTMTVTEGETTEIPCAAQGHPIPQYRWFRFYKKLRRYRKLTIGGGRFSQLSGSLFIRESMSEDSGRYQCVVNNSVGSEIITVTVRVTVPLVAYIEPQHQLVNHGESATFNCSHSSRSETTAIQWLHDGQPLDEHRQGHTSLVINSAKIDDQGMYQCMVEDGSEIVQGSAQLLLGNTLPRFESKFKSTLVQQGSTVSLECKSSGTPLPMILWHRDGSPVLQNEDTVISTEVKTKGRIDSRLDIANVRVRDGGEVECTATNIAGRVGHVSRINVYGLPEIRALKNLTAASGMNHTIRCYVIGYPLPAISWQREGGTVDLNTQHTDYRNGTLTLRNLDKEQDQGRYSCVAKSEDGHLVSRDMFLRVITKPVVTINKVDSYRLNEQAVLTCVVQKGDEPITKVWQKDNDSVPTDLGISVNSMRGFSALLIPKLQRVHNGLYTCIGRNNAGESRSSVQVQVQIPPSWLLKPVDVVSTIGQQVVFNCRASGYPLPRIRWYRISDDQVQDVRNSKDGRLRVLSNSSLLITELVSEDSGRYECSVKNGIGTGLRSAVRLTIGGSPDVRIGSSRVFVAEGKRAKLVCQVSAILKCNISWLWNERILSKSERLQHYVKKKPGLIISTLIINPSKRSDSGRYWCHAANRYGTNKKHLNLTVIGVPDSPTKIQIIESNNKSTIIRWSDPSSAHIISYFVIVQNTDGRVLKNITVDAHEDQVEIDNLNPNQQYQLEVYSRNVAGLSSPFRTSFFATNQNGTYLMNSVLRASANSPVLNHNSIYIAVYSLCAICLLLVVVALSLYLIKRRLRKSNYGRSKRAKSGQSPPLKISDCSSDNKLQKNVYGNTLEDAGNHKPPVSGVQQRHHVYSVPSQPDDTYYDDISPYATFQLPDSRFCSSSQPLEMRTFTKNSVND